MHRLFLLLILLVVFIGQIMAQTPGYLGKRLSFQAEAYSIPALSGPTTANRSWRSNYYGDKSGGVLGLSWRLGVQAAYALSRKHQLTVFGDWLKTGMISNAYTPYQDFFDAYWESHYLFYHLRGTTAGFGFRSFHKSKGALAPLGRYHGYNLQATWVRGKIMDKRSNTYEPGVHAPLGIKAQTMYYALGYEFGVNYILKDRLILNVGGRINIPLQFKKLNVFSDVSDDDFPDVSDDTYTGQNQQYFENNVVTRLSIHSLFMLSVGAGLLLY